MHPTPSLAHFMEDVVSGVVSVKYKECFFFNSNKALQKLTTYLISELFPEEVLDIFWGRGVGCGFCFVGFGILGGVCLSAYMCIHIHVYTYVCLCICLYVYVFVCLYVGIYVCVCNFVCVCICVFLYEHRCVCVGMCLCFYMCVCTCVSVCVWC